MELTERFFGVNNRTILYELGLKPEKDGDLVTALARKAIRYAGGDPDDIRRNESFSEFFQRLATPASSGEPIRVDTRSRYSKNSTPPRCKHLLTVQVIRQSVYPRWLSAPYPDGPMSRAPDFVGTNGRLDDLLGLGMPLILELQDAIRLPGSNVYTDQVTDLEARAIQGKCEQSTTTTRQAWSFPTITTPPLISPTGVYQQLDPAWGLYLEGLIRWHCTPYKGRVSVRGRHLLAQELAHLTPALEFFHGHSSLQVYGWGNGRIHVGTDAEPEGVIDDLLQVCNEMEAYIFSRDRVFTSSPDSIGGGFMAAYCRLIQSGSLEEIRSVISL